MRRETWIAILLCVDLGLVGALAYAWKTRPVAGITQTAASKGSLRSTNLRQWFNARSHSQRAAGSVADKTLPWQELASPDLKEHVAKLRAAECPEETVKDIAVGAVDRMFASREAALKLRPEERQPWEPSPRNIRNDYTLNRQVRELVDEKRRVLRDALGYDVLLEYPPALAGRYASYEAAIMALPESKREGARAIMEAFWNKQDDLQERTKGFWELDDLKEREQLARDRKAQLAKILTPDEFLDFEIAASGTAGSLRSRLATFDASEKEFREIYRARMALEDVGRSFNSEDPEDTRQWRERYAAANQQVEAQVQKLLGDERYADYKRSEDYQYRNLAEVAKQNGVDKDAINKAYDAQKFAQQEVRNILRNNAITPEQRTEMFRSMQGEYDKLMTGILGEATYQRYREAGAYMIYSREPVNGDRVVRQIMSANGETTIIQSKRAAPVLATPPATIR